MAETVAILGKITPGNSRSLADQLPWGSRLGLRVQALGLPIGAKQTEAVDIANPESDEFMLLLRLYEPSLLAKAQALVDAEMALGRSVVHNLPSGPQRHPASSHTTTLQMSAKKRSLNWKLCMRDS